MTKEEFTPMGETTVETTGDVAIVVQQLRDNLHQIERKLKKADKVLRHIRERAEQTIEKCVLGGGSPFRIYDAPFGIHDATSDYFGMELLNLDKLRARGDTNDENSQP